MSSGLTVVRAGIIPVVSALPANPYNGQEIYYEADATNGIYWHLVYRAVKADGTSDGSAYKWHYVGGPPLAAEVDTDETSTSGSYAALTTPGPSVTVPLAGDYKLEYGANIYVASGSASDAAAMSVDIGASAAADADAISASAGANGQNSPMRVRTKTGLSASTALVSKYKRSAGSGTMHFRWRHLRVTPIRVG